MKDYMEVLLILAVIAVGILLLVAIVCLPILRIDTWSIPVQREALQSSINRARMKKDSIELAAITMQMADFNRKLAKMQYYDSIWLFDLFYWDGIRSVEPVK